MKQPPEPTAGDKTREESEKVFGMSREEFSQLHGQLYQRLLRMSRSPADAEDAVQEAYIRSIGRARQPLEQIQNPLAYFTTVGRNFIADQFKRQLRLELCFDLEAFESGDRRNAVESWRDYINCKDDREELAHAIAQLPKKYHDILVLALAGYPPAEIAHRLGIPKNTVSTYISRARLNILQRLEESRRQSTRSSGTQT